MSQASIAHTQPAPSNKSTILIIDDESINLDIMRDTLEDEGYHVLSAIDGEDGWNILQQNPQTQTIAVDRMMPKMDGMAFVAKVKSDKRFNDIPIIMQTAAAASHQVREGIEAGIYYYLTKPFNDQLFLSLIEAALQERTAKRNIDNTLKRHSDLFGLMVRAEFSFRTLEEASTIAFTLGSALPNMQTATYGLNEILINAIEHGNLGITYQEKKQLLIDGTWMEEVQRRLALPEQQENFATLDFTTRHDGYYITVSDCGDGFDWKPFLELDPARATDPNGRGIHMAYTTSFDDMYYNDEGNVVTCFIRHHDGD